MGDQLIKKSNSGNKKVFPKTYTSNVFDQSSEKSLQEILNSYNAYFISYTGNTEYTRLQVPYNLRRRGLWITYVTFDKKVVTEWYNSDAIDDTNWSNDLNWEKGNQGTPGKDGETPNITIGSVITGNPNSQAKASITGETPNLILNMTIPQGVEGPQGQKGDSFKYADFTQDQLESLRGPQGIQGERGIQGEKGDTGPQGPQGPKGNDGTGVTILGSYASLSELQAAHPVGNIGDSYIVSGNLYVWFENTSSWQNVGTIQGPQGEQGLQGLEGKQGAKGEDGISITSIEQTTTSSNSGGNNIITCTLSNGIVTRFNIKNGQQGLKGEQGPQGIAGVDGITPTIKVGTVDTGEEGTQASIIATTEGTTTSFNFTIPRGNTGAAGPKGETGATGATGPKGDKGDAFTYADFTEQQLALLKGPKGDKGDQGETGPQGLQGIQGIQGNNGENGATFKPSVSSSGDLSWTNDKGLINPGIVNIKGEKGEKGIDGISPKARIYSNKLQISIDNGESWTDTSEPIAAWFRWISSDNGGKLQISRDKVIWEDISTEFINNLKIQKYVSSIEELPDSPSQGYICMVGPDESLQYTMYVYDSTGWVNTGKFNQIQVQISQETGDNSSLVMSQKACTDVYGYHEQDNEFIRKIIDENNQILCGFRYDGTVYLQDIDDLTKQALQDLELNISNKVDIEYGKGLINKDIASASKIYNTDEYLYVMTDSNNKLLLWINEDGEFDFGNSSKLILNNLNNIMKISPKQFVESKFHNFYENLEQQQFIEPNQILTYSYNVINVTQSYITKEWITEQITTSKNSGNYNILFNFINPLYTYENNAFDLSESSTLNISIIGNNSTFIGSSTSYSINDDNVIILGNYYKVPYNSQLEDSTKKDFTKIQFISDNYELLEVISKPKFAESVATVVDSNTHLCKIKLTQKDLISTPTDIIFSYSYTYRQYTIEKIEDGYAYFISPETVSNSTGVNFDYYRVGNYPRYVLVNADSKVFVKQEDSVYYLYIPIQYKKVYECDSIRFFNLTSDISHLNIQGIKFIGNCGAYNTRMFEGLIYINGMSSGNIYIHDNTFKYIRNSCVTVEGMSNFIKVCDNYVYHCESCCKTASNVSESWILRNRIDTITGFPFIQTGAITSFSKKCIIRDNYITNYSWSAINAGTHWQSNDNNVKPTANIIIEDNIIELSDDFNNIQDKYQLMDSGAIYLTIGNSIICRHNIIKNQTFNYYYQNAIYCDDGATGLSIYGNLFINASTTYDIGLRKVSPSTIPDINGNPSNISNTNNLIMYNIITGKYQMEGRDSTNSNDNCIKGMNFIIVKDRFNTLNNIVSVYETEEDYYIYGANIDKNVIYIPTSYKDIINKLPLKSTIKYKLIANK